MAEDKISIEIMEDGTIKSETEGVAGVNHRSAEDFLKAMGDLVGGEVTRKKRPMRTHAHTHQHQGHSH